MRTIPLVAALLCPAAALANGRAPLTNGVHFRPGDIHSLYVATTFGLLISHDDGCTFRWVCEDNIGYGGPFDPKYRIAQDGAIFATTFSGLRVSRDGGCTFTTATADQPADDPGRIAGSWIDAIDIGPTGEVWVVTANNSGPNNVFRSTDDGVTFEPRGLPSPTIWWKSVAIAPARAQRIYATGYEVAPTTANAAALPTVHLEITDDDGASWAEAPLTGVVLAAMPQIYVVGVDHTNPDLVYLASSGANPPSGDRLYRSIDGGATWSEALATTAPILDVALEQAGGVLVATLGGGSLRSDDRGATFAPMASSPQLACVGQRDDGAVYGCGANWQPDFEAVARSTDGTTWDKVFRFVELAGPVECATGTPEHDTCGGQWPALQAQFGATGPTCNAPPADDTPVPKRSGGCCDAGATTAGGLGAIGALALGCAALLLRRRR